MKRYWCEERGFGDVVLETEHYIVVRFDADPWVLYQIAKF